MTAPPPLPPRPAYDWRDVFIAAVLAGGFGYGVWKLAKVKLSNNKKRGRGDNRQV
jgi:hypothetical protein